MGAALVGMLIAQRVFPNHRTWIAQGPEASIGSLVPFSFPERFERAGVRLAARLKVSVAPRAVGVLFDRKIAAGILQG
jgi:hypothetical protein